MMGIDPHIIDMIRDQIRFAGKLRHPETVNHVRGQELEVGRRGRVDRTYRDMQFIGGYDAQFGIAKLPPELVADNGHVECGLGLGCVLDGEDHACRGKKQHYDDQHGDDGPGQLHLVAAVNLRRLAEIVLLF